MSHQGNSMDLAGIPFEPGLNDLDELHLSLEELPAWDALGDIVTEALELASFARDELAASGVPPLRYFDELRPLVWGSHSINQHRARASHPGQSDPLVQGIRQALANWDCPVLKGLACHELRAAYALAVAARVLSDLSRWNPHPEEEEEQLEDLDARMNDARQALGLEPIHETAAYFRRQALRTKAYKELSSARSSSARKERAAAKEMVASEKAKAGAKGGKPGEVKERHRWAWRYLEKNLESVAYDSTGRRLSRHELSEHLNAEILHAEWCRQHPGARFAPKTRLPSAKTLRESPIWLKGMGYHDLPQRKP